MSKFSTILTKEFLLEEYQGKQRDAADISKEVGCSSVTVLNYIDSFGIPRLPLSITNKCRSILKTAAYRLRRSNKAKKDGIGKWMKGKKRSEKSVQKMVESMKEYVHSDETKAKISEGNKGQKRSKEFGEAISLRQKDKVGHNKGKKFSDEARANMSRAALIRAYRNDNACHGSKPELLMKSILEDLRVPFEEQYIIQEADKPFKVDFYLNEHNAVIEVDGLYWHAHPGRYKSNDMVYNGKIASEVWNKDFERNSEMRSLGYRVLRFWENNFDKDLVIERLDQLDEVLICA